MADVLKVLNIPHDSRRAVCPQCGQRTLTIHGQSNTCRCFKCEPRSLSTIDVVMLVLQLRVGEAIRFLAENFQVPSVKGKLTANKWGRTKRGYRTYSKPKTPLTIESLMLSPAWPKMPTAPKIVLAALMVRVPCAGREQGCLHAGYDHIEQWSGFARATVSLALAWLRSNGWIRTEAVPTRFRTRQGFPVRELFIRLNSQPHKHQVSATSYVVQKRASQYAGSKLNSSRQEFERLRPNKGLTLQ
jgi:hypothetical protein